MEAFAPQRILVIRFYFLGDVLLVTPLLCALKQRFPDCRIVFLTDGPAEGVLTGHAALNEILVCRPNGWDTLSRRAKWKHMTGLLRALRRQRFDYAINLQPGDRGGLWSVLSGARVRAGYAQPDKRLFYFNRLLPFMPEDRPRVEQMMDALRGLGWDVPEDTDDRCLRLPSMTFSAPERAAAHQLLAEAGWEERDGRPLIAIHPGRLKSRKTWFDDRFAAVADGLRRRFDARLIWLGAPEEAARIQKIQSLMTQPERGISTAGRLNLKETGALLEQCDLFFGIDSSPMHVASAVETPTVSLFSFSHVAVWKPRDLPNGTRHIALQKPQPDNPCNTPHCCEIGNNPCMLAISVDDVLKSCAELLSIPRADISPADLPREHAPQII